MNEYIETNFAEYLFVIYFRIINNVAIFNDVWFFVMNFFGSIDFILTLFTAASDYSRNSYMHTYRDRLYRLPFSLQYKKYILRSLAGGLTIHIKFELEKLKFSVPTALKSSVLKDKLYMICDLKRKLVDNI